MSTMAQSPSPAAEPTPSGAPGAAAVDPRAYVRMLLVALGLGPVAAAAAVVFDSVVAQLETLLWHDVPDWLSLSGTPWWYAALVPALAGALTAAALKLPGHGGHGPLDGLGLGAPPPIYVIGTVLAALAALSMGIVLGPEAPLTAIGLALGTLAARLARLEGPAATAMAAAGAFAAISTIFGGPLTSSLLLFEAVAASQLVPAGMLSRVLVPGLLAAGTGTLLFTGVADWDGVHEIQLSVSGLPVYDNVRIVDLAWALPLAIAVTVGVIAIQQGARRLAATGAGRLPVLIGAGLAIGLLAAAFGALADRPDDLVLFSGESAIPAVLAEGSAGVLVLLLAAKALAYGLALGAGFRGGPVFPAIFLGVAGGALAALALPGFELTPAVCAGIAAATVAALRLPFTGVLMGTLLTGQAGREALPITIIAAVLAWLTVFAVERRAASGQRAAANGR
jgi:H+/Cl- antiporter ClcA